MQLCSHVVVFPRTGEDFQMAITIRNKTVESDIREIGSETGEGPSALIARLVRDEKQRLGEAERLERARRRLAMRELIAALPPLSDEDKADMDRIMEEMYDENGLPR
jgi:hypothetical protein